MDFIEDFLIGATILLGKPLLELLLHSFVAQKTFLANLIELGKHLFIVFEDRVEPMPFVL